MKYYYRILAIKPGDITKVDSNPTILLKIIQTDNINAIMEGLIVCGYTSVTSYKLGY